MEKVFITDKQGNKVLPKTHVSAVFDDEGNDLGSHLGAFEDEVRGLVETPHQEYVTVATYASLPAQGSEDTIYRVSNYDGSTSQVNAAVYSEYAWNGSQYVFLCVKSQVGEVFDITVYNSNTKYADLASALGTNGANIPESLRKGGMSVKFVQSSDNKYVQYRCMADEFSTDTNDWVIAEEGVYVDNSEFVYIKTDAEGKILWAIKTDGKTYVGDADFLNDIKNNQEDISEINATIASISSTIEPLDIDTLTSITAIESSEFLEVITDSEDKIISYRDSEGVKHENVGLETNKLILTNEGMSDFQKALKEGGTIGVNDASDRENIELPEPKNYGLLNLVISELPTNGSVDGYAQYYDFAGNTFRLACFVEPQGQTSRIFSLTGGKGNYTLDLEKDVKFGSWVPQDSFHLKGCAKDVTRGLLATSYKFAYTMQEYLDAKPNRVLLKSDSKTTTIHGSGDRFTDWPDDARCLPDGFPCELYINGEYWGLYALQLKKHRKNYSMKKSDYTSFFLDADNFKNFWVGEIPWTSFEIKNPKDLVCMDGSAYDVDNPKELIDSTSSVYDATNKKHTGSAQTKAIIISFTTKYLEIQQLVTTGTEESLAEAKTKFAEYFDISACIFVYIYNCLMKNIDSIYKNTLWGTWKNGKIAPMLYDLDGMYGEGWMGLTPTEPSAYMWNDLYPNAAWPLALLWRLYRQEIENTYANLRQNKIISIESWKDVMYSWINRIGAEAYNRDIDRWPETPSYRENYTNTDYWEELPATNNISGISVWRNDVSYTQDTIVAMLIHPITDWYVLYKAKQDNVNQSPVTKFYDDFPTIGGYYNSPRRMEKWMTEQISLCDNILNFNNNL